MKIRQILEGKTQKQEAPKPRNFVAKNAINTGAGAHKDKKKAAKQGDVKHKNKEMDLAETSLEEYGDTKKGQKMLTKVQKRAVDRVVSKKADTDPKYAKKNADTASRAWDRMTDKEVDETFDDVKDTVSNAAAKVGDTLANALPKELRPFDNQTAANFSSNISKQPQPTTAKTKLAVRENLSEQYVGTGSSRNQQMSRDMSTQNAHMELMKRKYGPEFQDKPGVLRHYNQTDKVIPDPKDPTKFHTTTTLTPKDYTLSPNLTARHSLDPNQDYDYYYKGERMMPDHPLYDKVKQTHLDSTKSDTGNLDESSRNPDLMSQTDYDRYQQDQMDSQKRNFKRDELEHELGHEDRGMYWVVVAKNGKWEHTKAQPRQEGMNAAMRLISALHAKYPGMHLGMQYPNGQVENFGKGKK